MLSENERKLLCELTANSFATQQELADIIGLSRPAVANILSGLTEKGYIVGRQYLLNYERFIICVGGANLDRTYRLFSPMKKETSNPVLSSESYGGVARNIAENLGKLGCPAALMSIVGEDRDGERLLHDASAFMNVFTTDKLTDAQTGSYVAVLDAQRDLVVGFAAMEITRAMNADWIIRHARHLNLCEWILCDCNVEADAIEELVHRAAAHNWKLALIGVSSAKIHRIPKELKDVRILICNREESMAYFDTDETRTEELCRLWLETGVAAAVVTAGTEPYAYGEGNEVRTKAVPLLPTECIVSVTGAGDAFSAGILFGLIHGKTLEESLPYGEANSRLALASSDAVSHDLTQNRLLKEINK